MKIQLIIVKIAAALTANPKPVQPEVKPAIIAKRKAILFKSAGKECDQNKEFTKFKTLLHHLKKISRPWHLSLSALETKIKKSKDIKMKYLLLSTLTSPEEEKRKLL